jgi:uncharacterized protein YndB with AHSA1/START domain
MAPLTEIRRAEVVVQLPPIEVWHALTRPDYLSYWIADRAEVDLRVGGVYNLRAAPWLDLRARIERLVEGRRLVLRPVNTADDARIEVDLIKQAAAETRVCVDHPEPELHGLLREALENMRSLWERGVDLREARRGMLGVGIDDLQPADRPIPGVPEDLGVRISSVLLGGPAEGAGLNRGDVVVGAGGGPVRRREDLVRHIRSADPGQSLSLEVVRQGKRHVIEPTIAERKNRTQPPPSQIQLLKMLRELVAAADEKLAQAVKGLSDADAYRPEAPGKWSVAQVLAHLSVTERLTQCMLDEAIRGGCPGPDDLAVSSSWMLGAVLTERPGVTDLLARLKRDEVETLALLEGVPAEVVAFRPRWARVAHLALDFHTHSEDHLPQIARVRKAISA